MINNMYMYDKVLYIRAFKELEKIKDDEISYILESALRNQCIICTQTDLGEPLSFDDFRLSRKIRELIKESEECRQNGDN